MIDKKKHIEERNASLTSNTSRKDIEMGSHNELDHSVINARRSGSSSILVTDEKGIKRVERKSSDISIAVQKRLSNSAMPSIIPVKESTAEPVKNAADDLDRTGGAGPGGAFSEHTQTLESIAANFSTNINFENPWESSGLGKAQAEQLLEEYGLNVISPPPKVPLWLLFLIQFTNLLMVLLIITAILSIILYIVSPSVPANLYVGVLLIIVVILTCYETFSQEAKSDSLMEKFRAMVPEEASVIRDGQSILVDASQIVLGDVLRLKSGDKIPADCRVIANNSMKVDQSMITGESEPVDVETEAKDPNALEARNLIFSGSLVVDGTCLAVAVRTGDATLIGTMVEMTSDVGKASSTLKTDIEYFVKLLTAFALFQAACVFIVGLSRGLNPIQVFLQGFIVIMMGNVPQGLPTTVTACLFIVADNMGKQNVFVKKLDIVETLGSCSLICTDKTGTLTMNKMTVANLWTYRSAMSKEAFLSNFSKQDPNHNKTYSTSQFWLLLASVLNSRVVIESKSKDAEGMDIFEPSGDATELGIYNYFTEIVKESCQKDIENFRSENKKVHEIAFNSSFKWQMSIHDIHVPNFDSGSRVNQVMFVKGAPDVLISKCSHFLTPDGQVDKIGDTFDSIYNDAYETFGGGGERVLGFAMLPMEETFQEKISRDPNYAQSLKEDLIGHKSETPVKSLIFIGLVTLMDPPRPEVLQAVKDCHSAGVKVVMVTGDHPITATAISRKINLVTQKTRDEVAKERQLRPRDVPWAEFDSIVIHGSEIPEMQESDWEELVKKKEIVFARTSPEQKLTIVKEFTKAGHVTAMTGDGVNDSPALKQAAIGVAMGLNGSAVAKEAADLVLLDDNFASIVVGIKEGRLLFANLKKSVAYTLAHLVPEVIPVLLWAFVGTPQPMGTLLVICIDLLTELLPATSFAYERAESLIMQIPPRNPKKDKLTSFPLLFYSYGQSGIILFFGCLLVFFLTFSRYGVTPHDIFSNNNRYFPDNGSGDFVTSDGRSYDKNKQQEILNVIQGSWYLMIVCGQATHVWAARTTTISIFSHGIFTNKITNIGVIVAILLGCFVVYTPGLQSIVQSANPFSIYILYGSLLVASAIWGYTELRKWVTRSYPNHWINQYLAW